MRDVGAAHANGEEGGGECAQGPKQASCKHTEEEEGSRGGQKLREEGEEV